MAGRVVLAWLLLLCSALSCSAGVWDAVTPFADAGQVDVSFYSSDVLETRVEMLEERGDDTIIAIINYDGAPNDPPKILYFEEGKDNMMLGADHQYNGTHWVLVIKNKQDYEDPRQQSYRFKYDTAGDGSDGHRMLLLIRNINDNLPQIIPETSDCLLDENTAYPQSGCTFIVRDADGDTLSPFSAMKYEVSKGDAVFGLKYLRDLNLYEAQAALTVSDPGLDFEKFSVHIIELTVLDDPDDGLEGTTSYVVRVDDLADEPPFWQTPIIPLTFDEEKEHFQQVTAVDGDIGISAEIGYRLEFLKAGDEDYFSIDSKTGMIKVEAIDRDILESDIFQFKVTAFEVAAVTSSVTADMYIIIRDINDNVPTVEADVLTISIDEETAIQLDLDIFVVDPDLADFGTFSIGLEDKSGNGWDSHFLLIPKRGYQNSTVTISVTQPQYLDYEDPIMRSITLQIVTTEQADPGHKDSQDLIITLIDLNDEFPIFDLPAYTAQVTENSPAGLSIITLRATDLDAGDVVTHTLTSQSNIMHIDGLTGEITVASDTSFDYERQTNVVVQVLAEDLAGHRTYVQLSIDVIDVNDVQPDLTTPSIQPEVTENSPPGTHVVDVSATDVDSDADLIFSIDWEESFATKQGARVVDSSLYLNSIAISTTHPNDPDKRNAIGTLSVARDLLDYEAYDTLTLSITVTDLMTLPEYPDSKSRSALLAIKLLDVNDNAPEFTTDTVTAQRSVIEESRTDWLIGSVVAVDIDGPGFNEVVYSITEADTRLPKNLVKVDPIRGELRVDADRLIDCDADYEDKLLYNVTASDGLYNTVLTITIGIIDVNDNAPQHVADELQITIPEKSPTGTAITIVSGSDRDFTVPYHTISYFLNPVLSLVVRDLFAVDENTGAITVNLAPGFELDREDIAVHEIPILLRDNYNQQESNSIISQVNDTLKITVILQDVNDNAPELPVIAGCLSRITDDAALGTDIYPQGILATDRDEGDNAVVTFSVVDVERISDGFPIDTPDDMFTIDTVDNTGYLKLATDVKNAWGDYIVTLMAEDHGTPERLNNTETYLACILAMNDFDPVITFPKPDEKLRILLQQEVGRPLVDSNNMPLRDFSATDGDLYGDNALVTITLEGDDNAKEYFQLVDRNAISPNTAQLQLKKELDELNRVFELTIKATDHGEPPRSALIAAKVVVIIRMGVEPEFAQEQFDTWFWENSLTEKAIIPEAKDEDNFEVEEGDDLWEDLYYYIIGNEVDTPGLRFFALDSVTRELTLTAALDREESGSHLLYILTSNSAQKPTNVVVDPSSPSQIVVNVTVGDVNDNPPLFVSRLFPGGVTTDDNIGTIITTILAEDLDLNDTVTYEILKDTMYTSDTSLDGVRDTPFTLDGANLKLNFEPKLDMTGYFMFNVTAYDKIGGEGHEDFAAVKIYMIAEINRVQFEFNNPVMDVEDQRVQVRNIFTKVIERECSIDAIRPGALDNGNVDVNRTLVTTHFIWRDEPMLATEIFDIVSDRQVTLALTQEFLNLDPKLDLADIKKDGSTPTNNMEQILKIVLIVVSVVLGTLVILLFAAFFIRTRSLNRRLEALSTTKFGSQDSGLNRVGMSMPGANKRALEGSNPVWNEDIHAKDLDNVSQGSYDSDLIGVEESPAFDADVDARPSINPLSNSFTAQNDNFSFAKPITDL